MKKAFLLLLLPLLTRAQAPAACGCARNLAEVQRLLATNYAGYRDKVTPATRPRLDSLAAVLQPQADTAHTSAGCERILRQYLGFFRDGHVQLSSAAQAGKVNADSIRARYAGSPRLPWTRATFRAYLDDAARLKQPLEGIWRGGNGSSYEVGIVADGPGRYQGFVLQADSVYWVPGQVKFVFASPGAKPVQATYYLRNHAAETTPVQVLGDGQLDLYGPWYRQYPRPAPTPVGRHSFQMLDDTTALYRIASFDASYRRTIDSLTRANAASLARTRLLIVDVRGNGGGSDGSYRSLLPYLYTQPVQTVGVALYSTPENNRKYEGAQYPHMSLGEKLYYRHLRRRLGRHPGELVPPLGAGRVVHTTRRPRRQQHPEVTRVAVLQDRNCASTTEQFLLAVGQSSKATTFGENSGGVLDYANMQFAPLPCQGLRLGWATSRSFRLDRGAGIDNVGLVPAVRLDPAAPDLVEQVRAWYRQRR